MWLENRIEEQLRKEKDHVKPQVSIEVLTYRLFYIMGEVAPPGVRMRLGHDRGDRSRAGWAMNVSAGRSDVTISRGDFFIEVAPTTKVLPGEIVRVPERFF